jgi:hypothetical protein
MPTPGIPRAVYRAALNQPDPHRAILSAESKVASAGFITLQEFLNDQAALARGDLRRPEDVTNDAPSLLDGAEAVPVGDAGGTVAPAAVAAPPARPAVPIVDDSEWLNYPCARGTEELLRKIMQKANLPTKGVALQWCIEAMWYGNKELDISGLAYSRKPEHVRAA